MSKFPEAIPVPDKVLQAREHREKQVIRSTRIGVSFRIIIVAMELIGTLLTQSSALFTDAISNLVDIASTIFLIFCIKLAQRPPDRDHPFGHGRYEPFGGLLLGVLLMGVGGALLMQQIFGVSHNELEHKIPSFAWLIPLVAVVLLEICYRIIMHTAKRENSPALVADAVHYRVDSVTTLIAMITLVIAAYAPAWSASIDHLGAILIALFMIALGIYSSRQNFHQLMDKVPDISFFDKVRNAAKRVSGVQGTEKIRIQSYGPDAHVDIDVEVAPKMSVEVAHEISQQVRAEIQKAWPAVRDVTVHIEPYYPNDH